ncbi:uncharacterized protein [Musca autumnalis]|uniref:uncharacterized protein n=1 Tax=Musca autumnalis TaxID=221902 RepID=UPI003CF2CF44
MKERILNNIPETWEETGALVNEIAMETLGPSQKSNRKPWISEETWILIKQRNEKKARVNEDSSQKPQYNAIAKAVKRSARKDKRKYMENLAKEAEAAAVANNTRELHQLINKINNKKQNTHQPVRDRDGTLLTTPEAQLNRWREYFEGLTNTEDADEPTAFENVNDTERSEEVNAEAPTKEEVMIAIAKLKKNKAAGEDNIPPELLLADIEVTANIIHFYTSKFWSEEYVDAAWTKE